MIIVMFFFSLVSLTISTSQKYKVWIEAMDDEMTTIKKNKTWELMNLPKRKDVIGI